jgi:hypothetical protein
MPLFRCRQCGREAIIPLAFSESYLESDECQFASDDRALTTCPACDQGDPPARDDLGDDGWFWPREQNS